MISGNELRGRLYSLADEKYRDFNGRIVHTCALPYIGVRTPELKRVAKELAPQYAALFEIPAESYEEVLLKGLAIGMAEAPLTDKLPYIRRYAAMTDNWAACDLFCSALKIKKEERETLSRFIDGIIFSPEEFVCRTAIVLFFQNFKEKKDARRAFKLYESITPGRYYADMAIAWGISEYCARCPLLTAEYLERGALSPDIKKKAAQKIRDSRRISQEIKERATRAAEIREKV